MSTDNYVLGIDLGTRYSCVGVWRNGRYENIPDHFGNKTIPSVVAFKGSAKMVGHNALALKDIMPLNTIYDIKRIIGRKSTDPILKSVKKLVGYQIVTDVNTNGLIIKLENEQTFVPEQICSYILSEIKAMVTKYIGSQITKAVITVPAYFNDSQRQATLDSAKIAGLDVLKIINEPTAAALAYGMTKRTWYKENGGNVIIYDLGAGTLDVSVMNVYDNQFKTLAIGGNSHLGGVDIDYLLMDYVIRQFKQKNNIKKLSPTSLSMIRLKNAIENSKIILSSSKQTVVCIDDFHAGLKIYEKITRKQLESICHDFFIMCMKPLKDALVSANLDRTEIDEIILVGGSTKIPKIKKMILEFFKNTNISNLTCSMNPDEVVSAGAAIYGHYIMNPSDPFVEHMVLLDVTPLSLGVETLRREFTVIIPRNTIIPTTYTKIFSTDVDDQTSVDIKIFEGERKLTVNNYHLGTFELAGFEKGPRGYPKIKITFHVDMNGILTVKAFEKNSNSEINVMIGSTCGAKGRLTQEQIKSIIMESEKYKELDELLSTKVRYLHTIKTTCDIILANIKSDTIEMTKNEKTTISRTIKKTLDQIKSYTVDNTDIEKLKLIHDEITTKYSPLIIQINKSNDQFSSIVANTAGTDIHGDDDEIVELQNEINLDYEKQEIKILKQTIYDLTKNITSLVTNPISKFDAEDIELVRSTMDMIQLWIYTTSATSSIEFITKIDEINKFTEEIMKKYESTNLFEPSENFTSYEELEFTCQSLLSSIQSNFFSLGEDEIIKLKYYLETTMQWLQNNQDLPDSEYNKKLQETNTHCNVLYENINRFDVKNIVDEDVEVDESVDETVNEIDDATDKINNTIEIDPTINRIQENLEQLLDNLNNSKSSINIIYEEFVPPVQSVQTTQTTQSMQKTEPEILLKVNFNKLGPRIIRYKNLNYSGR